MGLWPTVVVQLWSQFGDNCHSPGQSLAIWSCLVPSATLMLIWPSMTHSKAINQQKAFTFFPPEVVSYHFGAQNQLIKGLDNFQCQHNGGHWNLCSYYRCQPPQPFLICLWLWVTTLSFSDLIAKRHSSTAFSQFILRAKTTSKLTTLFIKSSFNTIQTHGRGNIRTAFSNCFWRSPAYILDYTPQRKLEVSIFSRSLKIPTGMKPLC